MVKLTINNREVEAPEGSTILEAARLNGIQIPTLCFLKDLTGTGACRVCNVEVKGARSLCAACVYPINEGMVVYTNSKKALDARRTVVELIVSNHSKNCLQCIRNNNCELQRLAQQVASVRKLSRASIQHRILMKYHQELSVIQVNVCFAAAVLLRVRRFRAWAV